MKLVMCSVRDAKSEAWFSPMFFQARAQAVRSFQDAVSDKSSEFGKHPEDYMLYAIGFFDPDTGSVEALAQPEPLGLGSNLLRLEA